MESHQNYNLSCDGMFDGLFSPDLTAELPMAKVSHN